MIVFFYHDLLAIPFVFSLWIMHDQIRLSWLQDNADRTRRLCEDFWVVRLGYVLFLFLPQPSFQLPWRSSMIDRHKAHAAIL